MAGIRVLEPRGQGWEYSLDNLTWQTSTLFGERSPGVAFVPGVEYPVYCRNLTEILTTADRIPFGDSDNEDDLDRVARRGGRTGQKITLTGGLNLKNLIDGPGLPLVVDPDTGEVYLGTGVATPFTLDIAHYEFVAEGPTFVPAPGSPPALTGNYSGSMDEGSCDRVGGWAAKRDSLNQTVSVDIYAGTVKIATVAANEQRVDVATAIGSNQNQFYGFSYAVPPALRTGVAIEWHAYIAGTSTELTFSPKLSNVCGVATTSIVDTFGDGPAELTEGGATGTYVLKQKYSDGTIRTVRPDRFGLTSNITGISIDQNGVLTPGSNTINNTVTIGVLLTLGSNVTQVSVRILNTNPAQPQTPLSVPRYPDTVVDQPGSINVNISSPVSGGVAPYTWAITDTIGRPLPTGITATGTNVPFLTVAGNYPNGQIAIRRIITDAAGNAINSDFLLTVNRIVMPSRTLVSEGIVGPAFIDEGSTNSFRFRANYSDNTSEDFTHQMTKSLEGWNPGDTIDNEGNVTIPPNTVQGDDRNLTVVMNRNGTRYTKSTRVVDKSSAPAQTNTTIIEVLATDDRNGGNYGKLLEVRTTRADGVEFRYKGQNSDFGGWFPASDQLGAAQYNAYFSDNVPPPTSFIVEFRPRTNPSAVVSLNLNVSATAVPRRTIHPTT